MYVVFGATGQTGSAVADALLEKNQLVRVVLRSDKTAAAFAAALGRDVQAVAVPESDWQATMSGFGFSPEAVSSYSEMMRGFNSDHIIFEGGSHVQTVRGQTMIADAIGKMIEEQA